MKSEHSITRPRSNGRWFFLLIRWVSILILIGAGVLFYSQWAQFNQASPELPSGSIAAGLPVGGLTRSQARQRLEQAYLAPIELRIDDARFQMDPAQAGFQLNLERMLPESSALDSTQRWQAFRDFLWGQRPPALVTDLAWTYDPASLRTYLETEVAPRYDLPPRRPVPVTGRPDFSPGQAGKILDIDASIQRIAAALPSLTDRTVELPTQNVEPPGPAFENLEILLKQTLLTSGLDALSDIYLYDLKAGKELHFGDHQGQVIPIQPDVAFTASSIIKIPILISVFRHLKTGPDVTVDGLLRQMITYSSNDAADAVMKLVLGEVRGPLVVSEDVQKLGLQDTFLAGYFALGSPLLEQFHTPSNQRLDVNTQPDPYSQTTPSDVGTLLVMVYQCAQNGSGKLVETFPGEINQEKCRQIIDYLKMDQQPYLIMTGLPSGTPLAHKHGYGSVHDVITTIGDAGIVFSPGGDYVLVLFFNNPQLLLFDPANALIRDLSAAVYHYFNPSPPG